MSILYPDLSRTSFPESIDNFTKFLDILAADGPVVKLYQEAMQKGEEAKANEILQQIPAYRQKIVTAEDLNKFIDAAQAVERFYKTDIKPYAEKKQQEWKEIIDKFTYRGVYNSSTKYFKNNYVTATFGEYNILYLAFREPPIGTLPTNNEYWRILTIKGNQGESGQGLTFKGEWKIDANYTKDDCVTYTGNLWNCIQNNISQEPNETSVYWKIVYRAGVAVYPVTQEKPQEQKDGELWFKIVP